ncbi:MAG: YihY/virulence factor BrkB family protein [Ardenticatenaceae bacterium]|nr:YihY/virulence factor BrkB family protein [Ardenticatenaceae bacterium]
MKQNRLKAIFELFRDTAQGYSQDRGSMLAASLAYYTMFSLAPLIVLTVALVSLFVGEQAVQGELVAQIEDVVGREAAVVIESIIENASQTTSGITATIVSTVLLLVGASGVFTQLKRAINSMWRIVQPPDKGFLALVKTRALAFLMVIGVGVLLMLSLAISTFLGIINRLLADLAPLLATVLPLLDFVLSLTIITGCFALIFKFLPDAEVSWQDVGLGAAVTAVLFSLGEYLIGWYLGNWTGGAAYGAASSIILLLFWIYLSAQILLFGAEFTQVYANRYGSRLVFAEGVIQITHQRYTPQSVQSVLPVIEEWETADPPSFSRRNQFAVGLIGLAFGLLLGFLGSLKRK